MRDEIKTVVDQLNQVSTERTLRRSHQCPPPDRRAVVRVVKALQALLFPLCYQREDATMNDEMLRAAPALELERQALAAVRFEQENTRATEEAVAGLVSAFIQRLPEVKRLLLLDVEAMYEGDPAAKRREEIMICYPGFYAVSIYRLAHELYQLKLPLIPRIMTEFAHEKTGIDIHPGATIGEFFCILCIFHHHHGDNPNLLEQLEYLFHFL